MRQRGEQIEYDASSNLSTDWIDQPNPTIEFKPHF